MGAFTIELDLETGIGHLTFDLSDSKVNTFSIDVLKELDEHLDALAKNEKIKALILDSGKPAVFIAGADLKAFKAAENDPSIGEMLIRKGHQVFSKLSQLPFPTIALIDGVCLGGGLECALACTYRIATDNPKTQIGLPEVNLGIIPGWGGTQRLPRLIGLQQALKIILSGKPVNGKKAYKLGVVDDYVPYRQADHYAKQFLQKKHKPKKRSLFQWLIEKNPIGRAILFSKSREQVLKKTKGHYPAPIVALDLIKRTHALPLKKGLEEEAKQFIVSSTKEFACSRHLINLFFVGESLKKQPRAGIEHPAKTESAAVLGAGTMGGGIAWALSNRDIPVRMKDLSWDAIGKGYGAAHDVYKQLLKIKRLTPFEANRKFHSITGTLDYSGFKNIDYIVEAVSENLQLKRKILTELEENIAYDSIIASNTSSLTVEEMSEGMRYPDRFIGMHFFNPVNRMPLVEIVPGPKTSQTTIATAVALCKKLKKTPIVVGDCPGFLVNRIFMLGANEVLWMVQEGTPLQKIEKALLNFGMPMSPFILIDEVGIDVIAKVSRTLYEKYGERMKPVPLLQEIEGKGWLGKKTKQGFYKYDPKEVNPYFKELEKGTPIDDEKIVLRFICAMLNEATRCLEEDVVDEAGYLDMALVLGTGFPPFRGGLLRYADSRGVSFMFRRMKELEKECGERFSPSKYLEVMDQDGRTFYSYVQKGG